MDYCDEIIVKTNKESEQISLQKQIDKRNSINIKQISW